MLQPIVIVGAGGFGREVLFLLEDINSQSATYDVLGYVDDDPSLQGRAFCGKPVLGPIDWFCERQRPGLLAADGIGGPAPRKRLVDRVRAMGYEFATLVHPDARVGPDSSVGKGTVVCAGVVITTEVVVGDYCLINLNATIGHQTELGSYVSLFPGAHLSGNTRVGTGAEVGTGAVLIPGTSVGEWAVVGAGSVVTKPVPANSTVVGLPARVIKTQPDGWHLAQPASG